MSDNKSDWLPSVPIRWSPSCFRHLEILDAYMEMSERLDSDWRTFKGQPLKVSQAQARTITSILRAYSPQFSGNEIAKIAKLSTTTVNKYLSILVKAGWLEVNCRRCPHPMTSKIIQLHAEGKNYKEIGNVVGLSPGKVSWIVLRDADVDGVECSEAAKIVNRSYDCVMRTILENGIPCIYRRKQHLTAEGFAELVYVLQTEEKTCPICGDTFFPKTKIGTVCSRRCQWTRDNMRKAKLRYTGVQDPNLLRGWRKQLRDVLHSCSPLTNVRWVEFTEALKISGLTTMQLRGLMQSGILHTRLHPTKMWTFGGNMQPIRLCLESELKLAREVYAQFAARS